MQETIKNAQLEPVVTEEDLELTEEDIEMLFSEPEESCGYRIITTARDVEDNEIKYWRSELFETADEAVTKAHLVLLEDYIDLPPNTKQIDIEVTSVYGDVEDQSIFKTTLAV